MSNTQNNLKSYLLSKCIVGYGIINGLINATIFYFMEKGHPDALFYAGDIIKDLTFTTFLLGFLLALIVMPLTVKDLEKGKCHIDKEDIILRGFSHDISYYMKCWCWK